MKQPISPADEAHVRMIHRALEDALVQTYTTLGINLAISFAFACDLPDRQACAICGGAIIPEGLETAEREWPQIREGLITATARALDRSSAARAVEIPTREGNA